MQVQMLLDTELFTLTPAELGAIQREDIENNLTLLTAADDVDEDVLNRLEEDLYDARIALTRWFPDLHRESELRRFSEPRTFVYLVVKGDVSADYLGFGAVFLPWHASNGHQVIRVPVEHVDWLIERLASGMHSVQNGERFASAEAARQCIEQKRPVVIVK